MWIIEHKISVIKVLVSDLICQTDHVDWFCLTETWLQQENFVSMNKFPTNYLNFYFPRTTSWGGGGSCYFSVSNIKQNFSPEKLQTFTIHIPQILSIFSDFAWLNIEYWLILSQSADAGKPMVQADRRGLRSIFR